jgi:hypothetical protein
VTCRIHREIEQQVAGEGLTVVEITSGHRAHLKVRVRAPDGRSELFICSCSPGDTNTSRQQRAMFRRFARGHSTKHHHERKSK